MLTPASNEGLLRLHLTGTLHLRGHLRANDFCFSSCLALLVTNRKNSYSNRTRLLLIAYVVTMFLLSSVAITQAFVFITKALVHGINPSSLDIVQLNEPITLPSSFGVQMDLCLSAQFSAVVFLPDVQSQALALHNAIFQVHQGLSAQS